MSSLYLRLPKMMNNKMIQNCKLRVLIFIFPIFFTGAFAPLIHWPIRYFNSKIFILFMRTLTKRQIDSKDGANPPLSTAITGNPRAICWGTVRSLSVPKKTGLNYTGIIPKTWCFFFLRGKWFRLLQIMFYFQIQIANSNNFFSCSLPHLSQGVL